MLMSRVFQVKPKRIKRSNGTVLTPDMVVTVTTMQHEDSKDEWLALQERIGEQVEELKNLRKEE